MAHKLICETCGKIVYGTENVKQRGYKCMECKIAEMRWMDEGEYEDWSKELKRRNSKLDMDVI